MKWPRQSPSPPCPKKRACVKDTWSASPAPESTRAACGASATARPTAQNPPGLPPSQGLPRWRAGTACLAELQRLAGSHPRTVSLVLDCHLLARDLPAESALRHPNAALLPACGSLVEFPPNEELPDLFWAEDLGWCARNLPPPLSPAPGRVCAALRGAFALGP